MLHSDKTYRLCEAELGEPLLELTHADYNAGDRAKQQGSFSTWGKGSTAPLKWKDASAVNPLLKGVSMVSPLATSFPPYGLYLLTSFHSRMSLSYQTKSRFQGLTFSTTSTLSTMSLRFACAICFELI
jgi:hypothetical protein